MSHPGRQLWREHRRRSIVPAWLPENVYRKAYRWEGQFLRRITRGTRPGQTSAGNLRPPGERVEVYVASLNTARATELCIRSLRQFAGRDYLLTVGDGGSTDGSLEMLERLAQRGWLTLDLDRSRPSHGEWLDRWVQAPGSTLRVFVDSDVEFLRAGGLDRLWAMANRTGAALVAAERLHPAPRTREPVEGRIARLAERFSPWLFAADPPQLRTIDASFRFELEETSTVPEGAVIYDTGARFLRTLREQGLPVAFMPGSFTRYYLHFAGLTWRPMVGAEPGPRERRVYEHVERRLSELRLAQDR